jgi:hypothetical protein
VKSDLFNDLNDMSTFHLENVSNPTWITFDS